MAKLNISLSLTKYSFTDILKRIRCWYFETVDIVAEDALDMIAAIRWYAGYMGFPEMEILPDDPRVGSDIAV